MSKKIDIPIVSTTYVASDAQNIIKGADFNTEDNKLDYLEIPREISTFNMPSTNLEAETEVLNLAITILQELCDEMTKDDFVNRYHSNQIRFDLTQKNAKVIQLLNETLGSGEVSVIINGVNEDNGKQWHIQESVFTGLWREVLIYDKRIISDNLVVGSIPEIVINKAFVGCEKLNNLPEAPANIMNAQAILAEIKEISLARGNQKITHANSHHIINLSLLPATPEDLKYMADILGDGNVSILSRGFGNCRIVSTKYTNVWWVKFFNNNEKLIQNTIEITAIPTMALAADEDFSASLERLQEWLKVMK